MNKSKSNCVYCGLPAYGSGCRFAPKGIHVHATPNKCMYCGLTSIGYGCKYAPTGKHVRFGDFGFINNESSLNVCIGGLLLKSMLAPINNHQAYKLGLIDVSGNVLKKPVTSIEKKSLNIFEGFLIKLKSLVSGKLHQIIDEAVYCNTIQNEELFNAEKYEKEIQLKESIDSIIKQLYNTMKEYQNDLSSEKIEQCVIEGFIKNNE